ncbi:MAG: penicillin acylase family protein, partial [Deltaproteobacteria bacterium]|nr:penicillin acylase family protein [Deltaproteobacteria bacterium]
GLSTDVSIRTVFNAQTPVPAGLPKAGSYRIEDVIASTLTPSFRTLLQRYADGVNRYVVDLATGANGATLPAEYVALAGALAGTYVPSPWTIEDSLAIGRYQAWSLSWTGSEEATYGQAAQAFAASCGATPLASCYTFGLFADLTRVAPATTTYILGSPAAATGAAAPALAGASPGPGAVLAAIENLPRMIGMTPGEKAASNNWVMRSPLSGHAVVANDPHQPLQNPSIFYLMQVTTGTRNVGGVAFPGTPVIPIGHNDHVGWGDTVAGYDVTDVYYFPRAAGGLPADTVPVPETYNVRGSTPYTPATPIFLVPGYGPVIAADGSAFYTARWTGQEPSNELLAFYQLNQAKSVDEAFEAVKTFQVGAQNFVFADVNGNIGYYPHAYVPIRKAGCFGARLVGGQPTQVVPWAPMPGFDGSCIWTGRISDAALPQTKNPASNRIVTANNDITGVTANNNPLAGPGDYLYAYPDIGYRAARATQLLSAKASGYTLDDFTTVQADNYSAMAADVVPGLLAWFQLASAQVEAKGLGPAVAVLSHWADAANPQRFRTPTGLSTTNPSGGRSTDAAVVSASNAAMVFHALLPRLAARILDPSLEAVTFGGQPLDTRSFLAAIDGQVMARYLVALTTYAAGAAPAVALNTGLAPCGGTPATCAAVAVSALDDTVQFLSTQAFASSVPSDWIWGRKHRVTFDSLLADAGVTLFNYGPFANDGGLYTVDVANFSWNDDGPDGFVQHAGANVRFSAEMIAPGNVVWRAVIPGGQPDSVQNENYQSQIPLWLSNAPGEQPWTAAQVQDAAVTRIVFRP